MITTKDTQLKTAENDIECYVLLNYRDYGNETEYSTFNLSYPIKSLNEKITINNPEKTGLYISNRHYNETYWVGENMFVLNKYKKALRTTMHHFLYKCMGVCIIPKGTRYYEGTENPKQYASESMIITSIIRYDWDRKHLININSLSKSKEDKFCNIF